jgi:hypothetical protein
MMRGPYVRGIAGIALGLLASAGCGEDPGVEQGTVPFKETPTESLNSLKSEMQKNMQTRAYLKRDVEANQPAAKANPAAGPQSAAKGG